MRIAAGILMIIGAIMLTAVYGSILPASLSFEEARELRHIAPVLLGLFQFGFTLTGAIFAFKRKHWKLCLTVSILLSLLLIYTFFTGPLTSTLFAFPGGILPITLVCFGKREWES